MLLFQWTEVVIVHTIGAVAGFLGGFIYSWFLVAISRRCLLQKLYPDWLVWTRTVIAAMQTLFIVLCILMKCALEFLLENRNFRNAPFSLRILVLLLKNEQKISSIDWHCVDIKLGNCRIPPGLINIAFKISSAAHQSTLYNLHKL